MPNVVPPGPVCSCEQARDQITMVVCYMYLLTYIVVICSITIVQYSLLLNYV